jgi:hypothetical protein
MYRLVHARKCGRFHEHEHTQRVQPQPWAPGARYVVGRAVCIRWVTVTATWPQAQSRLDECLQERNLRGLRRTSVPFFLFW